MMHSEKPAQKTRNYNIDLLKLTACIAVIGLHTMQRDISVINALLYYLCGFAIPVFFLSSGFILLNREKLSFKYPFRKTFDILRVVVLWNVLYGLIRVVKNIVEHDAEASDVFDIFQSIVKSLLQKGGISQMWFMGALIIVYWTAPFIHRAVHNGKWKYLWGSLVCVSLMIQTASMIIGCPLQRYVIQTFRVWTWLQYFTLGGGISYFSSLIGRRLSAKWHALILLLWSLFAAVWQFFMGKFVIQNTYAEFFYDDAVIIIWVILLFTLIEKIHLNEKAVGALEKLSPLTMGVYIIHIMVRAVVNSVTYLNINSPLMALVRFVVVTAASFAAVVVISKTPLKKYLLKV